MLECLASYNPSSGSSFEKPELYKVGFVDIKNGFLFFGGGGSKRLEPDRTAAKFVDKGGEDFAISFLQSQGINPKEE